MGIQAIADVLTTADEEIYELVNDQGLADKVRSWGRGEEANLFQVTSLERKDNTTSIIIKYENRSFFEKQKAYQYLDAQPTTIAAKEHRPAYSSDGDYFSKPNVEEVFDKVYAIMSESNPDKFPDIY